MKIVVLVIASPGVAYDQFLANWRAQVVPDNVKIWYLFAAEKEEIRGDCIYVRGKECVKPGLHYKTLAAMRHVLSEPFDYLLRTNLSSFISFRKLSEFLENKPTTNCVAGTYIEGSFLSGAGYVLTPDLVESFIEWCEECEISPMCHCDDEFVGAFVKERAIPFYSLDCLSYTPAMELSGAAKRLHVRFKTHCKQDKRAADIEQHKAVIEMYNSEERVFYIAHYRSDEHSIKLLNYCVKAIQLFYPHAEIVICESESNFDRTGYDISGALWVSNPIQNSGTIGCLKDYLVRYESTRKQGVFIQDSMILKGAFDEALFSRQCGFIWHFSVYYDIHSIEHDAVREYLFELLSGSDMDCSDYLGCFGSALYGSYTSIHKIWNTIPFDKFMQYKERSMILMDLERIIGAVAFQQGLMRSVEDCSLCGDIFMFPQAFQKWYVGQAFEELQAYPYKETAIKIWKLRHIQSASPS